MPSAVLWPFGPSSISPVSSGKVCKRVATAHKIQERTASPLRASPHCDLDFYSTCGTRVARPPPRVTGVENNYIKEIVPWN